MLIDPLSIYLPTDPLLQSIFTLVILAIIGFLAFWITKKTIIKLLANMFKRTNTQLDDIFISRNIFNRLAYILPALIFYNFAHSVPLLAIIIQRASLCLIVLASLLALNSLLSALGDIYENTKYSKRLNIKSYLQISKLLINILGSVILISILLNKDPTLLLSGLVGMTAVLLLIFKDTILSFVASLQISSNDLFKIGDWVEVPQFGADGDVIDIALHTVKIQNWDKTFSVIPTHKLIDSTFKNWRGMSESGGRRIKRSIYIDMNSISLCNHETLDRFKKKKDGY